MSGDATPDNSDSSRAKIDNLCDAFEDAWRDGPRPQIQDFIAQGSAELRPKLFYELLLVELEFRRNAGEEPTREEYLDRYPAFAREIEAVAFSYGASAFATSPRNLEVPDDGEGLREGLRISHYQLVEKIGEGAMGEVWKAQDTRLNRPVAIKLPRSQTLTEDELRRFLREGKAVGQLKHPQLAAIHDIGRWGNSAYIVVDYVDGQNLRKRLDHERLTHREVVEICADVAEALYHAHERGVVHRDLKPANIIIDRQGRSHVIDFGLAKWATEDRELTLHGELLGTPAYMSPEQARGEGGNAGPATDIYSLGVILYEMLTGECPFSGGHGSVLHQIANSLPVSPRQKMANVPSDLETICLKALEKDPLRRFKSIQEMAVDLRRFERGEPIVSRPPGVAEKAWYWARRRRAFLAAALIGIFAIGITLVASSLALQNKVLRGYRNVELTTDPPGAQVAFARLSDIGELLPDQVTQGGRTPAKVELLPGDYFVEAVWPDGRFHQVLRRVPGGRTDVYFGRKKTRSDGHPGSIIVLPAISCPSADVTDGMDEVSIDNDSDVAVTSAGVSTFLLDRHNITVGDVRRLQLPLDQGIVTETIFVSPAADNASAVQVSFDLAVYLAERLGKRLPTNLEYQRLADLQIAESELEPPSAISEPAGDIKHGSKSEFIRYTAPYNPKGVIRLVRSTHPRFAPNK